MADDTRPPEDMTAALAGVGIVVTPEGKARARRKRLAAQERLNAHIDEMRARVGIPPAQTHA